MPIIIYIIIIIFSALWVRKDAKNFREKGVDLNPASWSTFVFLFWIIAFPLYLILKFSKYKKIAELGNQPLPAVSKVHNWWIVIIFIGVPFLIISFFMISSLITAKERASNNNVDINKVQTGLTNNHKDNLDVGIQNKDIKTASPNLSNIETYSDLKYGFYFGYPRDLKVVSIDPVSAGNKKALTMFKVYDAQYVAPAGATGQNVRTQQRSVRFTVYPYSSSLLLSLKNEYKSTAKIEPVTNTTINIDMYKPTSGLIGPYSEAIFHNSTYIITASSVNHENLMRQILTTFHF